MTLVTVSEKRHRVYHRHFDHDEARRLRAEGWSLKRLADHFGVSATAVERVCNPKSRERMARHARKNLRSRRRPCRGGCGRLVWPTRGRTGYCRQCGAERRVAPDVGDGVLRCTACRQWKPDHEFGRSKGRANRRGYDSRCRACSSGDRRRHRHRKPEFEKRNARRRTERLREVMKLSAYIVFKPNGDGSFQEIARVDAASPAHAVEQGAPEPGEYVAVPEGRFKLLRVKPVQTLRVVPGDD